MFFRAANRGAQPGNRRSGQSARLEPVGKVRRLRKTVRARARSAVAYRTKRGFRAFSYEKNANALSGVQTLVRRNRQHIDIRFVHVYVDVTAALRPVDKEEQAALAAESADFRNGRNRSRDV